MKLEQATEIQQKLLESTKSYWNQPKAAKNHESQRGFTDER